jgi:hypothetical protein
VGDEFDCEPLGSFSVKGKEKSVLAYEVHSAEVEGPSTHPPRETEAPGEPAGS